MELRMGHKSETPAISPRQSSCHCQEAISVMERPVHSAGAPGGTAVPLKVPTLIRQSLSRAPCNSSFILGLLSTFRRIRMIPQSLAAQLRNVHLYLMFLGDAAIFAMAFVVAHLLRFEFSLDQMQIMQIKNALPVLVFLKLVIFFSFRLYKGMWRYFSLEDFWRLAQASMFSMLLTITMMHIPYEMYSFSWVPFSVFLTDGVLTFVMAGGFRMTIRSFCAARSTSKGLGAFSIPRVGASPASAKRILIIGAGSSGEKIIREIHENPQVSYNVVGFLDDAPGKAGRAVHGVPILGAMDSLPEVQERFDIQEIFISVPSATGDQMRRILDICKKCNVPYRTLPSIGEIIDGKVSIKALRDVDYEDLLRRPPVVLDMSGILHYLSGRTVLVTGAGGSIGSELCRQIIRFHPEKLVLVDSGEANLFNIQMELRNELKYQNCHCILTSVQSRSVMDRVYGKYRPEVVFHAAAYKHVPMLERNPWEAIQNNVLGSKVTMELALKHGVKRFVLVSTDKAVRPTNVMGTTKRLTELILQSLQYNGTRFMAVRFGNVVGSSGSVVPLFRNQIKQGGPVTVTHPEVTRYFMTIPEASQLILQAGAIGEGGEIFVLKMGTPVKIVDMARDLIRLSGKEPDKDIPIVFSGLRPGEKLYEELIADDENVVATKHDKIMVLRTNGYSVWNGHGDQATFRRWLNEEVEELGRIAEGHDPCEIKRKLKKIVPEYAPQETDCVL